MKKILFLTALCASPLTFAALPTGVDNFQVNVPLFKGGYEFGLTALAIQPYTFNQDYALAFPSPTFANGTIKTNDPRVEIGYQLFVGYILPCSGNDVRLTYSNFYEHNNSEFAPIDGFVVPPILAPEVAIPAITADVTIGGITAIGTELLPANTLPFPFTVNQVSATNTFRQHALDADFGQYINIDNFTRMRWFLGVRTAHVKHKFNVVFDYASETLAETAAVAIPTLEVTAISTLSLTTSALSQSFNQTADFTGVGPRLGVEGSFNVSGGFGLFGSIATALLVGQGSSSISETFTGNLDLIVESLDVITVPVADVTLANIVPAIGTVLPQEALEEAGFSNGKNLKIVPNIEAKIGINYTYQLGSCLAVNLEAGYYVNHYFNAIAKLGLQGNSPNSSSYVMDASFAGPYIAVGVTL